MLIRLVVWSAKRRRHDHSAQCQRVMHHADGRDIRMYQCHLLHPRGPGQLDATIPSHSNGIIHCIHYIHLEIIEGHKIRKNDAAHLLLIGNPVSKWKQWMNISISHTSTVRPVRSVGGDSPTFLECPRRVYSILNFCSDMAS